MLYRQRPVQVEEPSQEEIRLANLSQSGEDVESLLSGGASINDLVMAGVLEDDYDPEADGFLETTEEFTARREREKAEDTSSEPLIGCTAEELLTAIDQLIRENRDCTVEELIIENRLVTNQTS